MGNKYDVLMRRIGTTYIFGNTNHFTSSDAIREVEDALGYALPDSYKEFLTKYGCTGGDGTLRFRILDSPSPDDGYVEAFYGIRPGTHCDLMSIKDAFELDLPQHLIPIASSPGGQIVLSLSGVDLGRVYWWAQNRGSKDPYEDMELIAYDFDKFINSITTAV